MDNRHKKRRRKKSVKRAAPVPLKQSIALVGFRGVGKSTIAQYLAELRPARVVSLDDEIQRDIGMSIEDFVKREGWPAFRSLELRKLQELSSLNEVIILDTGGGIVEDAAGNMSQEKIDVLKRGFFCIYLSMPDDLLVRRLRSARKTASRPALPGGDAALMDILARRKPMYLRVADAVVDVSDVTPMESAARISRIIHNR